MVQIDPSVPQHRRHTLHSSRHAPATATGRLSARVHEPQQHRHAGSGAPPRDNRTPDSIAAAALLMSRHGHGAGSRHKRGGTYTPPAPVMCVCVRACGAVRSSLLCLRCVSCPHIAPVHVLHCVWCAVV